jgi:hypothetical protein
MRFRHVLAAIGLAAVAAYAVVAYAATLTTNITANIEAVYTGTGDLSTRVQQLSRASQAAIQMASGTSSNQANALFEDTRTLVASATEELDLYGGLTDAFGTTLNFVTIKAIRIKAATANTNNVVVGNASSNPFTGPLGGTTPTLTIPPGGLVMLVAPVSGWAVTNASSDKLRFTNSAGTTSVSYDLIVVGTQ